MYLFACARCIVENLINSLFVSGFYKLNIVSIANIDLVTMTVYLMHIQR